MARAFSLAEARHALEEVVQEAARGEPVPLVREGKVVAFVVRPDRIEEPVDDFVAFLDRFRAERDLEALDAAAAFDDLRDRSPGREVDL